jgi:membrane associated rhomboid family serine protease
MADTNCEVVIVHVSIEENSEKSENNNGTVNNKVGKILIRVPWFLLVLSATLIYTYIHYDNNVFAYDCKKKLIYINTFLHHLSHLNTEHIAFNLFNLCLYGIYITYHFTDIVNIFVYAVGVLCAALIFHHDCNMNHKEIRVVGASGGINGIIGAVLVFSLMDIISRINYIQFTMKEQRKNTASSNIVLLIVSVAYMLAAICSIVYETIVFMNNTNDRVSHVAHIGGFGSGVGFACLLSIYLYFFRSDNIV